MPRPKALSPRIDPARRPLGGPAVGNELINKDPNFHYVWVSENQIANYRADGHELCKFKAGGVASRTTDPELAEGSNIDWMGHKLMRLPMDEHIARYEYGQSIQDQREQEIRSQEISGAPRFRGIKVVNTTSEAVPVEVSEGF